LDQGFAEARARSLLLNDFWSFVAPRAPGANSEEEGNEQGTYKGCQSVPAARLAACGGYIDDPDALPAQMNGGLYPGPRFSAGIWTIEEPASALDQPVGAAGATHGGWMFGGIGRAAATDGVEGVRRSAPVDGSSSSNSPGGSCNVDQIVEAADPVTNLCDLWVFVPGTGFRLVVACAKQAEKLQLYNPNGKNT
jgi:hypothetical protein